MLSDCAYSAFWSVDCSTYCSDPFEAVGPMSIAGGLRMLRVMPWIAATCLRTSWITSSALPLRSDSGLSPISRRPLLLSELSEPITDSTLATLGLRWMIFTTAACLATKSAKAVPSGTRVSPSIFPESTCGMKPFSTTA
ncbi:hypothetical protein NB689_002084 [Xanthomonas sacchari]|nr:hypothetical protein [Xanthomonas sacchari]